MLEKLLAVERTAAGLVEAAEAEAARRTAQARVDAQKRHTELLKNTAAENERALAEERAKVEAERERRNREESERLSRLPTSPSTFRDALSSILEKDSK